MTPWKNHLLASKIDKMLFVGGVFSNDDLESYFEVVREAMPDATYTHYPEHRLLSRDEVAEHLRNARVGLCLSSREGAMFACGEYLLAGLPVVTIESQGGRDWWIDSDFCRVVPNDPDAVREAVGELIALDIDPQLIRRKTLKRITRLRKDFCDLCQSFIDDAGVYHDVARSFYAKLSCDTYKWRTTAEIRALLASGSGDST